MLLLLQKNCFCYSLYDQTTFKLLGFQLSSQPEGLASWYVFMVKLAVFAKALFLMMGTLIGMMIAYKFAKLPKACASLSLKTVKLLHV